MSLEAGTKALLDAGKAHHICFQQIPLKLNSEGVTYDAMGAAFVGYCYGESTSGQVGLLYHLSPNPRLLT